MILLLRVLEWPEWWGNPRGEEPAQFQRPKWLKIFRALGHNNFFPPPSSPLVAWLFKSFFFSKGFHFQITHDSHGLQPHHDSSTFLLEFWPHAPVEKHQFSHIVWKHCVFYIKQEGEENCFKTHVLKPLLFFFFFTVKTKQKTKRRITIFQSDPYTISQFTLHTKLNAFFSVFLCR